MNCSLMCSKMVKQFTGINYVQLISDGSIAKETEKDIRKITKQKRMRIFIPNDKIILDAKE